MPEAPARSLSSDVNPNRVRLIRISEKKQVNGAVLHYYFFDNPTDGERVFLADGTSQFIPWTTTDEEKDVIRAAFKKWKDVGIGLNFEEVSSREDAEVRIGFMRGDGAWSFVGRDALNFGPNERTMNFGWTLTRRSSEIDTAVHEIGHLVGFPHERQNPNAGIVWNQEAVYAALAKPPNSWLRVTTFWNIIRKIDPDTVQDSSWNPNSIMHYPFELGLINEPAQYRQGLQPAGAAIPTLRSRTGEIIRGAEAVGRPRKGDDRLLTAISYPFQPREPLLLFSSVAILPSVVVTLFIFVSAIRDKTLILLSGTAPGKVTVTRDLVFRVLVPRRGPVDRAVGRPIPGSSAPDIFVDEGF